MNFLTKVALQHPINEIDMDIIVKYKENQFLYLGENKFKITEIDYHYLSNSPYYSGTIVPLDKRKLFISVRYDSCDEEDPHGFSGHLQLRVGDLEDPSISIEEIMLSLQSNIVPGNCNFTFFGHDFRFNSGKQKFKKIKHNKNAMIFEDRIYSELFDQSYPLAGLTDEQVEDFFNLDFAHYMSKVPAVLDHHHLFHCEYVFGGKTDEVDTSYNRDAHNISGVYIARNFCKVSMTLGRSKLIAGDDAVVPDDSMILEYLRSQVIKNGCWNIDTSSPLAFKSVVSDIRCKFINSYSKNYNIL